MNLRSPSNQIQNKYYTHCWLYFDMFVLLDLPFPHVYFAKNAAYSLLILGSVFSDCVVFYEDYRYVGPYTHPHWLDFHGIFYKHDWKNLVPPEALPLSITQLFRASRSHWQDYVCPWRLGGSWCARHQQQQQEQQRPHLIYVLPLAITSLFLKWHLDRFSHMLQRSPLCPSHIHADELPLKPSVAIGRIFILHMRCGLKIHVSAFLLVIRAFSRHSYGYFHVIFNILCIPRLKSKRPFPDVTAYFHFGNLFSTRVHFVAISETRQFR